MANEHTEREIITNGMPDLSNMPQEILDMLVVAIVGEMQKPE